MESQAESLVESITSPTGISIIVLLALWDGVWRLLAMWKATKKGEKIWFVLLGVISSLGILPIVYYFFLAKKDNKN